MTKTNGHGQRVILYARVSSTAQRDRGLSIPAQHSELAAFASTNGYTIVAEVADTGGRDSKRDVLNRPGINEILNLCERGRVDVVLAQARDRFGEHPVPDLLAYQLREFGTRLATPETANEPDDDEGVELMGLVTDWNSRRERRTTAKRSRSRKLEHVRGGHVIAGHTAPYGFAFAGTKEQRTLEVFEKRMAVVRDIFELIAVKGTSIWGVKKVLDGKHVTTPPNPTKKNRPAYGRFWSRQFLRNVIGADVYKAHSRQELARLVERGHVSAEVAARAPVPCGIWWYTGKDYGGKEHRVAVPVPDAGIPREWVDKARAALASNSQRKPLGDRAYELRGMASCAECGRRMQTHSYKKKHGEPRSYYECASAAEHGKAACPNTARIHASHLEEKVWEFVASLLSEPERIVAGLDEKIAEEKKKLRLDTDAEEATLLRHRAELAGERDVYLRQNARGHITDSELDAYLNELDEIRASIDESLVRSRSRGENLRTLEALRDAYAGDLMREAFAGQPDAPVDEIQQRFMEVTREKRRERILDAYTPEQRAQRYRELGLGVRVFSRDEMEVSGVFGAELLVSGLQTSSC